METTYIVSLPGLRGAEEAHRTLRSAQAAFVSYMQAYPTYAITLYAVVTGSRIVYASRAAS